MAKRMTDRMPGREQPQEAPGLSLRSCKTGALVCDRRGQIRWANPAMHDILGYPEGELVAITVEQALGLESHAFTAVLDVLPGSTSVQGEVKVTDRDGHALHCELLALAPVSTDPEALQITITELPEGRRMERLARQRDDDLTNAVGLLTERYDSVLEVDRERYFLSNVCHEVQISVEAVAGYIELLAADLQRPAKPLAQIHTRMRRLSTVVGDLADLATDGSEERPLRVETVDLEDIVDEAASVVYTEALRKQQQLIIDIEEEAVTVRADPRLLRRLLIRLLAHAVRATPAHGTVRISASRPNDSCLIGVSDGGLPIDEDPAIVFRPFAKFHSEALRGDAAPGPALALAKQLVETQGGSIWVERPAEEGNTFCFSIPQ